MTAGEFEIETFSGQFVDTSNPEPATINVHDIAHALGQTCRFGGHCTAFYSVAEHAVFVSARLEQKGHDATTQLAGLHHDDAEAYLGDIPRPMKPLLGDAYESLSDHMDEAIITALGLPLTLADIHEGDVKLTDSWALFIEARHLLPSRGRNWGSDAYQICDLPARKVTPSYWLGGVAPGIAKRLYLRRHHELMARVDG